MATTTEQNCLESILCEFFNGGKKRRIFTKRVIRDKDGYVTKCFVKGGADIYEKFVGEMYHINKTFFRIEDLENFIKSLKNIGFTSKSSFIDVIEDADRICDEG